MSTRPVGTWLLVATGVAIAASVAAAIVLTGGPGQQRQQRLDERRLRDLATLERAIGVHYRIEGTLPATLEALERGRAGAADPLRDPVSGRPYGYRVLDARRYELCADFATASRHPARWERAHPAGPHCLRHAVEPAKDAGPG